MKLKSEHKVAFLMIGILFAWFALYIMFATFYEGLVEATIVAVHGGTYQPYYRLSEERFLAWMICIAISSVCLGIGFKAEELK